MQELNPSALDKLGSIELNLSYSATSDKSYDVLQAYGNVTSYSMLETLHSCPRKFQLIKCRAASGGAQRSNVDFAFGHSVGAGIQAWLINRDLDSAILNAMLAWNIPFTAEIPKKNKSIWNATIAVQKFVEFFTTTLEDWVVFVLPNGKPAIELSIEVDFENGYKHYMHIDVILRNRITGQLAIQENKTTGFKEVEDAIYANSSQALGYAVLLDMLHLDTSYEVFYLVYSTPSREWNFIPFTKNTTLKAEWIKDTMLDHAAIQTYRQMQFFPKRGDACYAYMRRCEFYGSCNLLQGLAPMNVLPANESAERWDYSFKLSELLAKQNDRIGESQPEEITGSSFERID